MTLKFSKAMEYFYLLYFYSSFWMHVSVNSQTDGSLEQAYCQSEYFRVKCEPDEVLLIAHAHYGRMRISKCVKENFGYVGCSVNVISIMDGHCSGRRSCNVRVLDDNFDNIKPCHDDLKSYLEVKFECVKVISPERSVCQALKPVLVSSPVGSFASITSADTGCGTADAPWLIRLPAGQRINITLLDFTLNEANNSSAAGATGGGEGVEGPIWSVGSQGSSGGKDGIFDGGRGGVVGDKITGSQGGVRRTGSSFFAGGGVIDPILDVRGASTTMMTIKNHDTTTSGNISGGQGGQTDQGGQGGQAGQGGSGMSAISNPSAVRSGDSDRGSRGGSGLTGAGSEGTGHGGESLIQVDTGWSDVTTASVAEEGVGGGGGEGLSKTCRVYAILREWGSARSVTLCGGEARLRTAYVTLSNSVEIRLITGRTAKHVVSFMLQYRGCADLQAPSGGWVKRNDHVIDFGCSDSSETWQLHCKGAKWIGDRKNCSRGFSLVIIIALALAVGLLILAVGIVCLKRLRITDIRTPIRHRSPYFTLGSGRVANASRDPQATAGLTDYMKPPPLDQSPSSTFSSSIPLPLTHHPTATLLHRVTTYGMPPQLYSAPNAYACVQLCPSSGAGGGGNNTPRGDTRLTGERRCNGHANILRGDLDNMAAGYEERCGVFRDDEVTRQRRVDNASARRPVGDNRRQTTGVLAAAATGVRASMENVLDEEDENEEDGEDEVEETDEERGLSDRYHQQCICPSRSSHICPPGGANCGSAGGVATICRSPAYCYCHVPRPVLDTGGNKSNRKLDILPTSTFSRPCAPSSLPLTAPLSVSATLSRDDLCDAGDVLYACAKHRTLFSAAAAAASTATGWKAGLDSPVPPSDVARMIASCGTGQRRGGEGRGETGGCGAPFLPTVHETDTTSSAADPAY